MARRLSREAQAHVAQVGAGTPDCVVIVKAISGIGTTPTINTTEGTNCASGFDIKITQVALHLVSDCVNGFDSELHILLGSEFRSSLVLEGRGANRRITVYELITDALSTLLSCEICCMTLLP